MDRPSRWAGEFYCSQNAMCHGVHVRRIGTELSRPVYKGRKLAEKAWKPGAVFKKWSTCMLGHVFECGGRALKYKQERQRLDYNKVV